MTRRSERTERLTTFQDLSPTMLWHAAVMIAYDGRDFTGSQRQPDKKTVEDECIRALKKVHAIESVKESGSGPPAAPTGAYPRCATSSPSTPDSSGTACCRP